MNLTRRLLTTLVVILLIISSAIPASALSATETETVIDSAVKAQMAELDIPGATVAVVANGEIILLKGYGFADLQSQSTVNPEKTLFRIGSVSKLVTWTAVMQLVEQGQLDLDTDINEYLDFTIPDFLRTKQPAAPITLRHLMTHTAGFEDKKDGLFYLTADRLRPLGETLRTTLPARIFHPGDVVAYSTYGTALAGYIVERASGTLFADYIEQNIFMPLSMNRSTFRQPLPAGLTADMARASRYINGELIEDDFLYVSVEPGGSMTTTAADMSQFLLAHLQAQPDTQILQPETLRLMHKRNYSPHQEINGMTLGFVEGTYNGQRLLYHGGDTFAFNSGLFLLPEQNIGFFVSYSGGDYYSATSLFETFMDHFYPAAASETPSQPDGAAARARSFTGQYFPNRRNFTSDESLLVLLESLQISVDENGYLTATQAGKTSRFVETAPGVYKNITESITQSPYGTFTTLYFETSPGGTTLFTDGKMSYAKTPWYATTAFTVAILLTTVLLLLVTLVGRFIAFLIRTRRRQITQHPRAYKATGLASTAFGLLTLFFLLGTLVSSGSNNPLYGVPMSIFGIFPPWSPILDVLPLFVTLTGAAVILSTIFAWRKGFSRLLPRLHYSLLSLTALGLIFILNYWNLM